MPVDVGLGASHDIIQILFYFTCCLATTMGLAVAWTCRYIILPMRDRHFQYLDHQDKFMDQMLADNSIRTDMHKDNLRKLSEIYKLATEIKEKVKCPVQPTAHHAHG